MGGAKSTSGKRRSGGGGVGRPNDATEYYVSGDGMWINDYLRNPDPDRWGELSESEKQYLADLDKATGGKVKEKTLYRSVDATAVFGNMTETEYENLYNQVVRGKGLGKGAYAEAADRRVKQIIDNAQGKTINEKGFMSTSKSAEVAEDWGGFSGSEKPIVLKINTSKNTKGVDVSVYDKNVSSDQAQREVLLGRNQSYKVDKISGKNGRIYVDVTMK